VPARAQFIMHTYAHLLGAAMRLAVLEVRLVVRGLEPRLGATVLGGGPLQLFVSLTLIFWYVQRIGTSLTSCD
jgi:hypothetical protein